MSFASARVCAMGSARPRRRRASSSRSTRSFQPRPDRRVETEDRGRSTDCQSSVEAIHVPACSARRIPSDVRPAARAADRAASDSGVGRPVNWLIRPSATCRSRSGRMAGIPGGQQIVVVLVEDCADPRSVLVGDGGKGGHGMNVGQAVEETGYLLTFVSSPTDIEHRVGSNQPQHRIDVTRRLCRQVCGEYVTSCRHAFSSNVERSRACSGRGPSAQVVDDVRVGAVVGGLVRSQHDETVEHRPVGAVAGGVHTSDQRRCATVGGVGLAGVEQPLEAFVGVRAGSGAPNLT